MIKTGILGAGTALAGELIRILINHPEVEIDSVYASELTGNSVKSRHSGLIGETPLNFSEFPDLSALDLIIIADDRDYNIHELAEKYKDLRIITTDMSPEQRQRLAVNEIEFVPALSEIFRKSLVRGAKYSRLLTPETSIVLIVLFPLALHLLLNDSITVKIKSFVHHNETEIRKSADEISEILHEIQKSFTYGVGIVEERSNVKGALGIEIELQNTMALHDLEQLYEGVYDDHNFTFLSDGNIVPEEVLGTQKCIIRLSKPSPDTVRIEAQADAFMRGGAGDAVHAMNLLFGLYEKIGLNLKSVGNYL